MSTRYMWQELKKLVVIDHEISNLKKQLSSLEQELKAEHEKVPLITKKHDEIASQSKEIQKQIDAIELQLSTLRTKESDKKARLEAATNPKEYSALEKELALLENEIDTLENHLVVSWEERDKLASQKVAAESELSEERERLSSLEQESSHAHKEVEEKMKTLSLSWEKQALNVPEDLRATYAQIRSRVPDPVVPIVSNSCSACFHPLLLQDSINLSTKAVIRCHGCYRFLFLPDSQEAASQENSDDT